MQCHYSSLIVFSLLLLLKVSSIECQAPPYSLTKTNRDVNQLTLQCSDVHGNPVSNAVFYRNGILNTSDECFNSSVSVATNKINFTISPKCEGLFTCGGNYGNGVVLSKLIPIYSYPERTSDYNGTQQSLRVVAGTSITLPCHVQVSALHEYTVKWSTYNPLTGRSGVRTEPHNPDYSLTLTNLKVSEDSLIYTCRVRSQTLVSGPISIDGQKTRLYVIEYTPPSILQVSAQTGTDRIIDFTSTATGSNLNFTWFLNNEQLRPSDEQVDELSSSETTGVLSLQTQKLNFNGQSKRLKLVITNKDVNDNDQSDSHEGWLFQVNKTITTNCSMIMSSLDFNSPQRIAIITIATVLMISLALNVVFCIILVITCCNWKPKRQEESTDRGDHSRVVQPCIFTPQEQERTYMTQLSTMSNGKEIQCIRVLRQISHGEASVTLSTQSEKIYMKRTTSENSSAPSETKYANPMSNILVEVAQSISNFEHTDIELLNSLADILQRVIRLAQLQQYHTILRHMSIHINEQIERIKYNVPTATSIKRYFSDSVVDTKPPLLDTGSQSLEKQSNSKDHCQSQVSDNGNDQPPLHTVNSKVETDDHDPQEEEEEEERELTEEEKDGLMKILDAMSSQLKPFL